MKCRKIGILVALAVALFGAGAAQASYLVTGSSGNLAASADFSVSGTNLIVTLTNTSLADVLVPADVLTALFFNVQGVGPLGSSSAVLSGGSSVFYDPDGQPAGGVVGGEWAYGSGLAAPGGATEGISSAGFGLFGSPTFPGANLAPPAAIDGVQYGILSAGDNTATGNAGVTGSGGLIKNQVTFTLTGLTAGFVADKTTITNVSFQYGTALTEPNIPPVPEPTSLLALGTGLLIAGTARRRRKVK